MNNVRINSTVSPFIEHSLMNYDITNEVVKYFVKLKKCYAKLKHVSSFCIPYELKPIIDSHPKLKSILYFIETDTQSNIMYSSSKFDKDNCGPLHHAFEGSPEAVYSLCFILDRINKNRIPFVADKVPRNLKKILCENCAIENMCKGEYDIPVADVRNSDDFIAEVNRCISFNFNTMALSRNALATKDIKAAVALSAFFNGTLIDDYNMFFEHIKMHPELCSDIAKSSTPLLNICFSIYRSYNFPSASDPNQERHIFSIDWHENNPDQIKTQWGQSARMDLYRVDVLPSDRNGITGSGKKRLLMGLQDSKIYYIAYTDNHDFNMQTIRRRVENNSFD